MMKIEMENLQVRQTDQVWYHHRLQVSSLAVDLQWCYCPLLVKLTKKRFLVSDNTDSHEKRKTPAKGRSFTSIQMVHTHTPPQWGGKLRAGHEPLLVQFDKKRIPGFKHSGSLEKRNDIGNM